MKQVNPSLFLKLPIPAPDFIIVYDGDCPVCARFFPAYSRLLRAGRRVELVDARNCHDLAYALMELEHIDLDRDAAVFFRGKWFAGSLALWILFSASAMRSSFSNVFVGAIFKLVYPILRVGRLLLLKGLGRSLIKNRATAIADQGEPADRLPWTHKGERQTAASFNSLNESG